MKIWRRDYGNCRLERGEGGGFLVGWCRRHRGGGGGGGGGLGFLTPWAVGRIGAVRGAAVRFQLVERSRNMYEQ